MLPTALGGPVHLNFEIQTSDPLKCTMNHQRLIVKSQMEEFITYSRVYTYSCSSSLDLSWFSSTCWWEEWFCKALNLSDSFRLSSSSIFILLFCFWILVTCSRSCLKELGQSIYLPHTFEHIVSLWSKKSEVHKVNVLKFWTLVACQIGQNKQQWRSSLIRVFTVCYLDKHFMNYSPDNQHFIWEQREKSVHNFRTFTISKKTMWIWGPQKPKNMLLIVNIFWFVY